MSSVTLAGLALLAWALPSVRDNPFVVAGLLALAAALSALKIHVPLARGWATMSTSFAALFVAMLTTGVGPALVIAAVSGWVQSAFHSKTRSPLWRHLFNSMMLVLSVGAAGSTFILLGGQLGDIGQALDIGPLIGATAAYFLTNSLIVSTAVAVSTGQPLWRCWHDNFLWTAPGYFLTAGVVSLATLVASAGKWGVVLFVLVPVAFIYHSYKVYFGRLHDEQKRVQAMADLHASAREDLAAEKERLAVTLRSIGDAVITTDLQGRVTMLNIVAEELTGRTQDKAIGRAIDDVLCLWDPEGATVQEVPIARILDTGRMPDAETNASLIAPDGARLSVNLTGAPMSDGEGQKVGVVLVVRDITESVRLTQERVRASKLESLGVLAGGIAHDFNNVLTAVVGNIALARSDETLSRETATWLEEAERACLRARTLTHQLLTFSRGGDPVKRPMHIGPLVDATVRFAVSGSNVRCTVDVAPDLWAVDADEGQVEQVVHNIVLNAKQAMPRGGQVHVSCTNARLSPGPDMPGGGAPVRPHQHQGPGRRHSARAPRADFRSVLHHQAVGHRTGAGGLARRHQEPRRPVAGRVERRDGHGLPHPAAAIRQARRPGAVSADGGHPARQGAGAGDGRRPFDRHGHGVDAADARLHARHRLGWRDGCRAVPAWRWSRPIRTMRS